MKGLLDNYIDNGYNDVLNVKFYDSHFSTIVRYVGLELNNHSSTSLLELPFLFDDNHGE